MAESENEQERPCLHCLMVRTDRRLLRRISACPGWVRRGRYGRGGRNYRGCREDRSVAELTFRQDGIFRQYLIEQLMREIMKFDGEFRREDAADSGTLQVRHDC